MNAIKLAIQKTGRLSDDTVVLLKRAGINFDSPKGRLIVPCDDFPLDLLMIRDDDIPSYVATGACEMGIVGFNVMREYSLAAAVTPLVVHRKLGFGRCRLSIAVPENFHWDGPQSLKNCRIATSYPASLAHYLSHHDVKASVITMSGSVEIATGMGMADAICDLVSSGATLRSNGLREVEPLYESEAVLIIREDPSLTHQVHLDRLTVRMDGVLKAQHSRYIMMNANRASVEAISAIVPGLSQPTVMPLAGNSDRVAIHMVAAENVFWETLERLKACGATDILVLPIEKLMA